MKKLIMHALEALYSEQFSFEDIVEKLSGNQKGVVLLRAYIAVQAASKLTEPLLECDVERALAVLHESELRLDCPISEAIVDLHRELAELCWLQKSRAILKGKFAHQQNEFSFEGGVYAYERAAKGPISSVEREKLRTLAAEISQLDRQLEAHELSALEQSAPLACQNAKIESYIRELQMETGRIEELGLDSDTEDMIFTLEGKLKRLIESNAIEGADHN